MRQSLVNDRVGDWEIETSRRQRMMLFAVAVLLGSIWFAWAMYDFGCFCEYVVEYNGREL